jgi:hypothetical protein
MDDFESITITITFTITITITITIFNLRMLLVHCVARIPPHDKPSRPTLGGRKRRGEQLDSIICHYFPGIIDFYDYAIFAAIQAVGSPVF